MEVARLEIGVLAEGEISESALAVRARAGDATAFGELVQRHMRRAYFAALGLVGSHADALDLSQDAFVRAWRARRRLDPARPFYPWLYQIIRRLCFNFTRDRSLHRRKLADAAHWIADEAAERAPGPQPLEHLVRDERRARVLAAIERLPAREREVLVLKEFEGLRYRDIAALIGIPEGTVMSRLYTARQHLAAELEGGP